MPNTRLSSWDTGCRLCHSLNPMTHPSIAGSFLSLESLAKFGPMFLPFPFQRGTRREGPGDEIISFAECILTP
jgi:hypothetical protein